MGAEQSNIGMFVILVPSFDIDTMAEYRSRRKCIAVKWIFHGYLLDDVNS